MAQARLPEIDAIKVLGVLNMLLVHAMRPPWVPEATRFELWYGSAFSTLITPSFLFCAGCLAATPSPLPAGKVRSRLGRLLPPYLLASLLALLFRHQFLGESVQPVRDLLLANAFGPYYFVFHMAWLIPASYFLSRMSDRSLVYLWIPLLLGGFLRDIAFYSEGLGLRRDMGFMVMLRSPLVFWGYFVSGFLYRRRRDELRQWLLAHRAKLLAPLVVVCVVAGAEAHTTPRSDTPTLTYPLVYALLGLLLLVRWRCAGRGPAIRAWLGDRTYSLFLFHLFFLVTVMRLFPQPGDGFNVLTLLLHVNVAAAGVLILVVVRDRTHRFLAGSLAR